MNANLITWAGLKPLSDHRGSCHIEKSCWESIFAHRGALTATSQFQNLRPRRWNSILRIFVFCYLFPFCQETRAQIAPKLLPFQGRLTDQNGVTVSNGVRLVQFKIFETPSGGSSVWAGELHRTTVNGGLVNVILGSKTPFTGVDFDQQLYLEITVDINGDNTITAADPPMLPRQAILPVVFAKEAADSRLLGGYDWTPVFGTNDPTIPLPASKLADDSLPGGKIIPASITSNQIAPQTIGPAQIKPNSITPQQIAQASIDSNSLAVGGIDLANLAQHVAEALNPPGTVLPFAGTNTPSGWLPCDGSPLYSTNYPALFAAIGTTWGSGLTNGVSLGNFNVPDLRGMFLRGSGTNGAKVKARGTNFTGGDIGAYQHDQLQGHRHSYIKGNQGGGAVAASVLGANYAGNTLIYNSGGVLDPSEDQVNGVPRTGDETKPASYSVNYIIKY